MNKDTPFFLVIFGVFLIIISPALMTHGMFMDGMIYATVSKNLADGLGTFWQPYFTQTCYPEFYEHPPLAMGIQSLFYRIFGDSFLIEKFYSFAAWLLVALGMVKVWRYFELKNSWLPVLFLMIIPRINWAATNNTLENTLAVFVVFSVYFYLKTLKMHWVNWLFSGLCIAAGFLTKGPFVLFVWGLPLVYEYIVHKKSFVFSMFASLKLMLCSLFPLVVLYLSSSAAFENLKNYYHIQLVNSLKNLETVESRWYIVEYFLSEIILPTILVVVVLFFSIRKIPNFKIDEIAKRRSIAFLLLVALGVFPIMVSMKQSGFYILPTFPIFALSAAFLIAPTIEHILARFFKNGTGQSKLYGLGLVVIVMGILLNVSNFKSIGRDKEKINDMHKIAKQIDDNKHIGVSEELWLDWGLQAYFQRYYGISLDGNQQLPNAYYLITNEENPLQFNQNLTRISSDTEKYQLYKNNFTDSNSNE